MSRRTFTRRVSRLHSAFHEDRKEEDLSRLMVHVICFGNIWHGDDGFGIRVFKRLCEQRDWPAHAKLFDAGTAGLSALDYFDGCRKVVIVDALKSGGPPGLVRRFTMDEIGSPDDEYSLHQLGVNHLLAAVTAAFSGCVAPEVVVIGAEIGKIDPFTNRLSPALEAALETVVELVALECAN